LRARLRGTVFKDLDRPAASHFLRIVDLAHRYNTFRGTTRPPTMRLFSATLKYRCSLPSFRGMSWRKNMTLAHSSRNIE